MHQSYTNEPVSVFLNKLTSPYLKNYFVEIYFLNFNPLNVMVIQLMKRNIIDSTTWITCNSNKWTYTL